jgi:hypothetical protein
VRLVLIRVVCNLSQKTCNMNGIQVVFFQHCSNTTKKQFLKVKRCRGWMDRRLQTAIHKSQGCVRVSYKDPGAAIITV